MLGVLKNKRLATGKLRVMGSRRGSGRLKDAGLKAYKD
jgi:hypothetical protein